MLRKAIITTTALALIGAFGPAFAAETAGAKVKEAAHETADATRSAAKKTVKATGKVAHKTAQATRHAAHKVANATRRAAGKPEKPPYDGGFHATTTREQRMSDGYASWKRTHRL